MGKSNRARMGLRLSALFLVLGLLASAVAGCSGTSNKPAGDDKVPATAPAKPKEYVVGLIMPQTGSQATFGADQIKAAQWAVEDINAKGGVNGTPLKLVLEDSQADPKRAVTAFDKLFSVDKAPVIISAWSAVVKALAPMAEQNKVLLFSVGANDPKIKELGAYTRTSYPLADVDIAALAKYSIKELGKKRAAVIYINNDTGKYAAELYKKTFEANGGQVVAMESHEPEKLDFKAQIAKLKAANPDVIHIQSLLAETPQIVIGIREAGIQAQLTSYSAAENKVMVDRAPEASQGLIYTTLAPDGGVDVVKQYLDRWQATEKRTPNGTPYTLYLYDTPYVIRDAILTLEKNKLAYNGENLLKVVADTKEFETPLTGKITFNADRSVTKPVYIKRINNKAFETVKMLPTGY